MGCNIHPSIPLDKPGLRIADVATGTAIWLLDLAQTLPQDTQFVGFDISGAQFPAPEDRPSHVKLYEHDVLKPFADQYHGFFDVVAVRLITAGLRGNDWDAAVKNLKVLLSACSDTQLRPMCKLTKRRARWLSTMDRTCALKLTSLQLKSRRSKYCHTSSCRVLSRRLQEDTGSRAAAAS